jgi:hypothetical protein
MDDLWPKDLDQLAKSSAAAPVNILKEQAAVLGKRTNGLLDAEAVPHRDPYDTTKLRYSFEIVAAALQNYRYELFQIVHGPEMYPVTFKVEREMSNDVKADSYGGIDASNEEEFKKTFALILNSQKARKVISGLLAQLAS